MNDGKRKEQRQAATQRNINFGDDIE